MSSTTARSTSTSRRSLTSCDAFERWVPSTIARPSRLSTCRTTTLQTWPNGSGRGARNWFPTDPFSPPVSEGRASTLPCRTLVIGGARSGKSRHAESLLAAAERVTYVATAAPQPDDDEWSDRVRTHQLRRPRHWSTVETGDVANVLATAARGDCVLVDCLTLWLTRVMDEAAAWEGDLELVNKQIDTLVDAWRTTAAQVVAVTNEVGQGVVPATRSGRLFRDLQGRLNASVARESDVAVMMVAGRPVRL